MKFIAHRGLTEGPSETLENNVLQINRAIADGFDCEIDLRYDGVDFWLGHDEATYKIDYAWLIERSKYLWVHCKNYEALLELKRRNSNLNYFWHQEDDYTITSHGRIWVYPGKVVSKEAVCVMPEWDDDWRHQCPFTGYGVCSDYIREIRERSI
jgi:hypothetical protein